MSAANPPQRVYRADLHTHTWDSSDSLANPEEIVAVACRRGVDLLAITDHNVLRTALALRDRYPELIVAGEEIKTTEGEIIGLFLEREIPRGLTPEETIARIRDQGGLVTVPHPLDRLRGSRLREPALRRVAHLVDAIEVVNARVTFAGDNRRAAAFAEQHGLALTAGSDAHAPHEVGAAYVLLDEPPAHEPAALLAQLRRARTGGGLSWPTVHFHSIAARWRKRLGLVPHRTGTITMSDQEIAQAHLERLSKYVTPDGRHWLQVLAEDLPEGATTADLLVAAGAFEKNSEAYREWQRVCRQGSQQGRKAC